MNASESAVGTHNSFRFLLRIARLLIGFFILRTVLFILWEYRHYFPADPKSDFLLLHADHFEGLYRIAFYLHIVTAPIGLILFSILSWRRIRNRNPWLHRFLGQCNLGIILFCVIPSSIIIACFSMGGWPAASSFIASSIALAVCILAGWFAANRDTALHRRWMLRAFAILLSAVVLRVLGGATEVLMLPAKESYQVSAWLSWLLPLAGVEFAIRTIKH